MSTARGPADPWPDLILALTRAATLTDLQSVLDHPRTREAGLHAHLSPWAPGQPGQPLPTQGTPVATLQVTGPGPARAALTDLLDQSLTRIVGALPPSLGADGAVSAFLQVTERLGSALEVGDLNRRAADILRALLPDVAVSVLECAGVRWAIRFVSDNATSAVQAPLPDGLLGDSPALRAAEAHPGPLFIDDWNAADQHIPASVHYRVAALQAFHVPEWPITVLSVGCRDRLHWTAIERGAFTGAALAYGQALERVARAHQLAVERATLLALVDFKERAAHSRNVADIAGQAAQVLRDTFERLTVAYLVPQGDTWRAEVTQGELPARLAQHLRTGVTLTGDGLNAAFAQGQPHFIPNVSELTTGVGGADAFGALALYPVMDQGHPVGVLAMGTRRAPDWTARERSVFRAVGRSLAQAVDRDTRERRLASQHAELQVQARSLQAFAQLSRDLGAQEDRYALIRRAQEITLSLLPAGFAVYYEPEGDLWRLRAQVGSLRDPDLQAAVDRGLPLEDTRNLLLPWQSGQPYYQDSYDPDTDRLEPAARVVGATATFPLRQAGELIGVFAVVQYEARQWTTSERALIEGVTRSLQLALDRAASVTELRRTSQDTARSNAALQAANEELEAFAYSVSHDLRAPVRHIAGFTDLLRRTLGDLSGQPKAERYLNIIGDSATQMNALIDAMLLLSRVTRQELHLRDVDLGALVGSVQVSLAPELEGRDVTLRVSPLPTVQADAALLRQVMTNLLSNAVKYSATRAAPLIEVWADALPGEWRVNVRDNGVGFDPAYAHKLFGVFQRLHRAEDFGGTGVGLANVRRIIQRHGGQVHAESEPDQGATFSFTLPRTDPL
ncbi:ATP-binding protein [Deinococcus xianganensis]|uniref:histidine kinase n=1 Tax=Deinococcus xianganensis TaxID=1507289 RepID=A0A6I4YJ33_9DEIO|nr:ATP-binding protein [Deinococcus xianganensis]MXV21482.1 GAF domain-containing protein [Deinococcus xianganensis]